MERFRLTNAEEIAFSDAGSSDSIDLRGLWFVLKRRAKLIFVVIAAVMAAAVFISSQIEDTYTAATRVLIDPPDRDVIDTTSTSAERPDSTIMDTEVQLILSRTLINQLVAELSLVEDPEFNPFLEEPSQFESATRSVQNFFGGLLGSDANADALEIPADPQRAAEMATADKVAQSISAWREGLTFVISISAKSHDAEKASLIVNTLTESYIRSQLDRKVTDTQQTGNWLDDRLQVLREEVRVAESAVEQFRIDRGMVSTGGLSTTEAQIAELTGQLVVLNADLAEKEARIAEVRRQRRPGAEGLDTLQVIDSPLISTLRGQRATLLRTIADLSVRYSDKHPERIRAASELEEIDAAINQEVSRVSASLETDLVVARNRVADMQATLNGLRGQLDRNNVAAIQLRELEREAEASRAIYEALLSRAEVISEEVLLHQPDARIVSLAEPPSQPSAPNHKLNLLVGALAALSLAGLFVVVLELFENGFASTEAVERQLGIPVIATVAEAPRRGLIGSGIGDTLLHLPFRKRKANELADYMMRKPNSAYTEAIGALYAAVHRNRKSTDAAAIALTSTLPSEGKTSLSLSLARLAANRGDRVVLVDADLRRRSLSKVIGVDVEHGFVDVVEDRLEIELALIEDPNSRALVLPAGSATEGTPSLVLKRDCEALIETLKKDFDLVVIDCPPVLPVVEARMIASASDAVVYAARWRKTDQKAVALGVKTLRTEGANILGCVLTRANLRFQALYDQFGGRHYKMYSSYYHN